jgi:ribosomal protein S18 acetylase RimI-like enzyme
MRVRPATADEISAVLGLWREAEADPSFTDDPAGLTRLVAHDPGALLVAEVEGRIVGSLIAGWDGWRGNMYRLAVAPEQRRRGVARALVEAGEERLRELGARRITAGVLSVRESARATWSKVDYNYDPAISRYVKNL